MALIRDIATLFYDKKILVEIDPLLLPHIECADKNAVQIISFNLYRLIYHIGTIQSRRFAPSNRLNFFDKIDLIEKIYTNTNEFRLKINDIRQVNGSETLISISEDFGIGLSVVIAEKLFKVKRSTIQKIYGTGRRPDWKCQLDDNRVLVVEGKGATSTATSGRQEQNALVQKTKEPGDIQVASLTILNENEISTNRYLDPPIESNNVSPEMENHILRAGHYASVFSFFGNSRLSRYYSQMRKRLEGVISSQEQSIKDQTFRELRYYDPVVAFKQQEFVGSFYNVENEKYIFVGVDKRLLSYRGFLYYREFEDDMEEVVANNIFILYKDGVLVIEINNIQAFSSIVNIDQIRSYQDNITISDIDEMTEISFSKYFEYILKKNDFINISQQTFTNELFVDLIATKGNQMFYFEFKILKKRRTESSYFERLSELRDRIGSGKLVLVTNAEVYSESTGTENIIVIDREKLNRLTKNSSLLMSFIE